jgi:exonuclease III
LHQYLLTLQKIKPIILTGDLNVAYLDIDMNNPHGKHIATQSCCTPQERQSFGKRLMNDFADALRYFHPCMLH